MAAMSKLWRYFTGPRLYRYLDARDISQSYEANVFESIPEYIFGTARFCLGVAQWGWPFALPFLAKQTLSSTAEQVSHRLTAYAIYAACVTCLLLCAACSRCLGRALSPTYAAFAEALRRAAGPRGGGAAGFATSESKEALSRYDFDFWAWPVEFTATGSAAARRAQPFQAEQQPHPLDWLLGPPSRLLMQTIGVRMTYPGCTALMNAIVRPMLQQTRARLVAEHRIRRYKLATADVGHSIELFFADRRKGDGGGGNGETLIVCCEGNAGYPEIGCTGVPLEAGYSVIGWNHPGFAGSTGLPFPGTEREFIEAVLEFSQRHLGFRLSDTALLAWSIGGYAATWAGARHPEIKYIVLDATFDNIEDLAVKVMPQFASELVRYSVRKWMHLGNDKQLCAYPGPVKLIRRTQDEMITTGAPSDLSSNRGNKLLVALLQYRYPTLVTPNTLQALTDWLALGQKAQLQAYLAGLDYPGDARCAHLLLRTCCQQQQQQQQGQQCARMLTYPAACVGDGLSEHEKLSVLMFIAGKVLVNMESTHCTPLTPGLFTPPWCEADEQKQGTAGASSESSEASSWEPV